MIVQCMPAKICSLVGPDHVLSHQQSTEARHKRVFVQVNLEGLNVEER